MKLLVEKVSDRYLEHRLRIETATKVGVGFISAGFFVYLVYLGSY